MRRTLFRGTFRGKGRAAGSLVAAAALLSCATPGAGPGSGPASLAVEVFAGFSRPAQSLPPRVERVDVLLDVTRSMGAATRVGPARSVAAQRAATRLIEGLPRNGDLGLHAVGLADVEGCQPAFRVEEVGPGDSRKPLLERLGGLAPAGEGSLASAVDGLRVYLALTDQLARARVVVMTDLDNSCGGDLCAAVSGLVEGGARVELLVFGDEPVPACLADFAPDVAWDVGAAAARPAFRVEVEDGDEVSGAADGTTVEVPAGRAWVNVDVDPPVRIGPVDLAPGATTRLHLFDFPTLDPPVREWRWETVAGPGAAPLSGQDSAP